MPLGLWGCKLSSCQKARCRRHVSRSMRSGWHIWIVSATELEPHLIRIFPCDRPDSGESVLRTLNRISQQQRKNATPRGKEAGREGRGDGGGRGQSSGQRHEPYEIEKQVSHDKAGGPESYVYIHVHIYIYIYIHMCHRYVYFYVYVYRYMYTPYNYTCNHIVCTQIYI